MAKPLKVLIKSAYSPYSGYGMDGLGLACALDDWGCDVYCQPVWVDAPLPLQVAHLLTKRLVAPFDLTINHWDPDHLGMSPEARGSCTATVAWTMWEFSQLKPLARRASTLRRRLSAYDLLLAYDQVGLDALEPFLPAHTARGVLQGGYDPRPWQPPVERDWFGDRFGFVMHGMLHNRKAPYTAVQAFNELKWDKPDEFDGATLSLHTTIADPLMMMEALIPKLRVFYEVWDEPVLREFYHSNHCLLAPSRGEGKNLPALEMATTGGLTAVTNWGGHTQWLNPEYAYPLDYELTPTDANHPTLAQDAKVSVQHMKDVMWHIFTNREEAKAKADLAAEIIPKMCSWDVVLESFWRRLRDLVPGKGEELYNKAHACRKEADPWSLIQVG